MANTSFTDVYDHFMSTVQDYQLNAIYGTGEQNLNTFLLSFLKEAIVDVSGFCDINNLESYADYDSQTFTTDIGMHNIIILAQFMKKPWARRQRDYVTQMQGLLTDTDFKRFSEANNLNAKVNYCASVDEELGYARNQYTLAHVIDFTKWKSGVYD
jgi:hypothetical protein